MCMDVYGTGTFFDRYCTCENGYRIALKFRGSLISRISQIRNHSRKYFLSPHAHRPHVRARASTTMALLEYFKREDAQYVGCKERSPKKSPQGPSAVSAANAVDFSHHQGSLPENECVQTILVRMVAMDHCFNLESRHL